MRGEHELRDNILATSPGSSPHARGTPKYSMDMYGLSGIIPACAGNTPRPQVCNAWRRDHPRMRGEHTVDGSPRQLNRGSSPHARGTPVRFT